jgi:hypothetical protein
MLIADISAVDTLTALLIPLLGPARELIEMTRNKSRQRRPEGQG